MTILLTGKLRHTPILIRTIHPASQNQGKHSTHQCNFYVDIDMKSWRYLTSKQRCFLALDLYEPAPACEINTDFLSNFPKQSVQNFVRLNCNLY